MSDRRVHGVGGKESYRLVVLFGLVVLFHHIKVDGEGFREYYVG